MATLQNIGQLKIDIADTLWNGTLADHQDCADQLMAYLTGADGQALARADAQQYDGLVKQWTLLSFGAFTILKADEQQNLLKTRLLVAIQAGYSAEDFTRAHFDMYESDEFLAPLFQSYSQLIRQNTEQLGSGSVEVAGTKYLPQIRYWVLDYSKAPSQSARRSSIDRLGYVNASPNTRQLTQAQRSWLLEVLKLYDLLNAVERPAEVERPGKKSTAASPATAQPIVVMTPPQAPPTPQPDLPTIIDQKLDALEHRVEAEAERSAP
jgi:hypothetical protein